MHVVHRGGRCQTQPRDRRQRLLANEVAGGKKRDGGLFAALRNHGEFRPALLKIKDRVRRISLGKEGLLRLHFNDSSAKSGVRKKGGKVECSDARIDRQHGTSFEAVQKCDLDCGGRIKGQEEVLQKMRVEHSAQLDRQRRPRVATPGQRPQPSG